MKNIQTENSKKIILDLCGGTGSWSQPYVLGDTRCSINARTLPSLPDDYILPDGWNVTAAKRSMTSAKFAEAFYRANR